MPKGTREPADHPEAEAFPKPHGADVGAHNKVELHRREAARASLIEGMRAHGPGDPATCRRRIGHEAAIGHVGTAAGLIGPQVIGAEHSSILLGHIGFAVGAGPIQECVCSAEVAVEGVGFSPADGRQDDPDDRRVIAFRGGPDLHAHPNCSRRIRSSRLWPGSCSSTSSVERSSEVSTVQTRRNSVWSATAATGRWGASSTSIRILA